MNGLTRGFSTLAGAAVAGILLWFATQVGTETASEYWATYGLVAAAGLTMALSQILGGWTKWGWPRFSIGVFLIGFLPVLLVGGWVLLARQPADWMNTSNWSRDLGFHGLVADLGNILPAIAFGLGLTFGFCFDTAGRQVVAVDEREDVRYRHDDPHAREREDVRYRREDDAYAREPDVVERHPRAVERDRDADEPLTADRDPYTPPPTVPVGDMHGDRHDDGNDDRREYREETDPRYGTPVAREREDR